METALALIDHIDPQAILLGAEARTAEQAIRLLAAKLEELGYVKPSYADAVAKREAAMPTGLPLGQAVNVAIPHTDPEHVVRPGVALGVLSAPVDFANMEEPDEAVPVELSRRYVSTARAAGDRVEFVELPGGGHMDFLDPDSEAHATLCRWLAHADQRSDE